MYPQDNHAFLIWICLVAGAAIGALLANYDRRP